MLSLHLEQEVTTVATLCEQGASVNFCKASLPSSLAVVLPVLFRKHVHWASSVFVAERDMLSAELRSVLESVVVVLVAICRKTQLQPSCSSVFVASFWAFSVKRCLGIASEPASNYQGEWASYLPSEVSTSCRSC